MKFNNKLIIFCFFIIILLLVLLTRISVLNVDFLYDVPVIIKTSFLSPSQYFFSNYEGNKGVGGFYRPLSVTTIKMDYYFWKLNPFGYHLTDLFCHALNCFLIFLIIYLIFPENPIFAASASILFSILPMNSEAINFIGGRADLLASTFYLMAFYLYLIYIQARKPHFLFLSSFMFFLSLLSKEFAITLPLMILAYEYFKRSEKYFKEIIKRIFFYLMPLLIYLFLRYFSLGTFIGGYKFAWSIGSILINPFFGYLKTIWLIFLPFRQENIVLFFVIYPALLIFCLAFLHYYNKRQKPGYFFYFSLMWILITLLPVATILPIGFDFQCTRFWYLSSVGISFLLSYVLFSGFNKMKKLGKVIVMALFVLFVLYNLFFLNKINQNWAIASDMIKNIKSSIIYISKQFPGNTTFYFCNIPDNYKGCYVFTPVYLSIPFYDKKINIIDDLHQIKAYKNIKYYIYDNSEKTFKKTSYSYVWFNKIEVNVDEYFSRNQLNVFKKYINKKQKNKLKY